MNKSVQENLPSDPKFALRLQVARAYMSAERDCNSKSSLKSRYLICSTPRSGSTLLTDYLFSSGVAGVPMEYMNDSLLMAFSERIGRKITDLADYLEQIEKLRMSEQGVFGMKAHFRQTIGILRSQDLLSQFLRRFSRIIRIVRRNKLAQAVSTYKAIESGFWTYRHEELAAGVDQPVIPYNSAKIAEALFNSINEENGWVEAIRYSGQEALVVYYEDLVAFPNDTLEKVFSFLNLPVLLPIRIESSMRKQSDGLNMKFYHQFLSEIQDK